MQQLWEEWESQSCSAGLAVGSRLPSWECVCAPGSMGSLSSTGTWAVLLLFSSSQLVLVHEIR